MSFNNLILNLNSCRKQFFTSFEIFDTTYNYVLLSIFIFALQTFFIGLHANPLTWLGICSSFCVFVGWIIPYLLQIRILGKLGIKN